MVGETTTAPAPAPSFAPGEVKWRERWYGSEPEKGSAITDDRGNLVAYFGGDETTHTAVTKIVALHNATRSQRLDANTVERRRKALREALEHVDNIAGEMNGAAERAHLIDADDAAMNLADAYGVEFAPDWEDKVAALATDPHQHGGKGA